MYNLTAADFADTGQWRLILKIKKSGLVAYLENTIHPEIPLQHLCSETWTKDPGLLKNNIEESVYKNPRLLDDFATRIIIYDSHTLFIPSEEVEDSSGAEEEIYKKIYPGDDADILADSDKDITALYNPGTGVKNFLMRTFPGSRITCNLLDKVRNLRKNNRDLSLFIEERDDEADLILLDNENLISASTHPLYEPEDLQQLVSNLLDAYDYKTSEVTLKRIEDENH